MSSQLDLARIAQIVLDHTEEADGEYPAEVSGDPFEIEPVPLSVFLYEKEYLGLPLLGSEQYKIVQVATNVYPAAIRDLIEPVLKLSEVPLVDIVACLWGKGSGKDFVSRVAISRIVYLLLCLHSPQRSYGMIESDAIDAINMAYSSYQARNVFFEPMKRMLAASPWFKERHDPRINQIFFSKNLVAHSGNSAQESFEGFNPILVVLDEIDAFKTGVDLRRHESWNPEHSAEGIYNSLRSSTQSRFPGLGKTVLLSFLRRPEGFMMQEYKKAVNDSKAYASGGPHNGATWVINPTKKRSDFDEEFRRNPEDSQMRYACVPTATVQHFFRNRDLIYNNFHYDPVTEKIKPDAPMNPWQDGRFLQGYRVARRDMANRYIHIDTGISNDAASICSVHVLQTITQYDVVVPIVKVDFFAVLDPHEIGEIMLEQVRDVVRSFLARKEGPPFRVIVTFDQYQSRDSMQILAAEGITTGYISVDKNDEPWIVLKDFIYTYRLLSPGSALVPKELTQLVRVKGNKIDHPTGGSKDCADTLAGAVWALNEDWYGEVEGIVVYDREREGGRIGIGDEQTDPGFGIKIGSSY